MFFSTDTCKGEKWCSSLGEAEALALDAIRSLHQQLDDDNNGNIDLSETKDVCNIHLLSDSVRTYLTFVYVFLTPLISSSPKS